MPGKDPNPNPPPNRPGPKITYGEILIAGLVVGLILLLLTNNWRLLFHPMMFLILIVIIGQYLIQKGVDRSRIYLLQLKQLQAKREDDLAFLREIEREISEILKLLKSAKESNSPQEPLAEAEKRLAQVYSRFRSRT